MAPGPLSWLPRVALIGARVLAVPHTPRALRLPSTGRRPALIVTDVLRVPHAPVAFLLESSGDARRALVRPGVVVGPDTVVALFLVASLPLRVARSGGRKNRYCDDERGKREPTNRPACHAHLTSCLSGRGR